MSEGQPPPARATAGPTAPHAFRWQAFFQRTREPLFVLNRHGRLLFVNRAWEALTGLAAAQARGLLCTRRKPAEPGPWEEIVPHLLCPPAEVHHGRPARARRLVPGAPPGRRWWDVEFFPLADDKGLLGILGKVTVVVRDEPAGGPPLPEKLMALRERLADRLAPAASASDLPAIGRVADQVRLAAESRVPVLLIGEPGTGKRCVARMIHHQGLTREQTFAALDCGALPATALAEVLFGTGGFTQRPVGTAYLAEPSRLPRDLQARLVQRLREPAAAGGFRVIAGSGADPAEDVRAGRLLDELHCALGTLVITLPPLRERAADLPQLVEHLLARANAEGERRVTGLTSGAWDVVRTYRWPGNLRELYAALQSARWHARGELIEASDLPAPVRLAVRLDQTPGAAPERTLALDDLLAEAERRLLVLALRKAQGKKGRAAELLSIWRQRLVRRMEVLGIPDSEEA
jgi:transcriptional regulator with PAS, ATPase and Fis domain